MARSVSIPSNAAAVAYADASELTDEFDWSDAIANLRGVAQHRYPSFERCDRWLDREDHAVLENGLAYVTVSEYCGLVAVCLVAKDSPLADRWCRQVDLSPLVECFGPELVSKGRFSNGEQVFFRRDLSSRENISSNGSRW